jgi:excisionase family DNA binding protein
MDTTRTSPTNERVGGPERASAELLDVKSVAALLDCSPRHVYRLADTGRMPSPLKLGHLARWNRKAIMGWIDAGCPMPGTTTKAVAR